MAVILSLILCISDIYSLRHRLTYFWPHEFHGLFLLQNGVLQLLNHDIDLGKELFSELGVPQLEMKQVEFGKIDGHKAFIHLGDGYHVSDIDLFKYLQDTSDRSQQLWDWRYFVVHALSFFSLALSGGCLWLTIELTKNLELQVRVRLEQVYWVFL